jgi:hypothetical protein
VWQGAQLPSIRRVQIQFLGMQLTNAAQHHASSTPNEPCQDGVAYPENQKENQHVVLCLVT